MWRIVIFLCRMLAKNLIQMVIQISKLVLSHQNRITYHLLLVTRYFFQLQRYSLLFPTSQSVRCRR
jgi:hypothetical protein